MSQRFIRQLVGIVVLLLCFSIPLALAAEKEKSQGLQKTMTNDNYNWFTINNLFNWYGNNGNSSYNTSTANSGLEFPKGSGFNPVFEDGVLWGGFHKGRTEPKVGGSAYRYGLQAGRVTGYGGPTDDSLGRPPYDNPLDPKYRVYRVRPDVTPTTVYANVQPAMEAEAALISRYLTRTPQTLFAQYQTDWNEWPAKTAADPNGFAPFKDVNGNGTYEPAVDIPGQPGADQTLYYVSNDLNVSRTTNLYFSPPIGIEVHKTVWGYNLTGALGNTIFASTVMINKSGAPLDSAFFVQWSDPDLGDAGDDYAGCDIGRSLGFIYNGKNYDAVYGEQVPAAGYDFFQGPIVATGNESDSAVFRLAYRKGYINLGMTTFDFFINGSVIYTDPPQGVAGGDVQWYRLMNARITTTDAPFIDPTTGAPTKFTLSGDPLAGKGWLDGTAGLVPGDRRICLVTGPFTLANRDTQELVVATIVGQGGDRISSIAVLKYYSDLAQSAYNQLFNISRPPPTPDVKITAGDGQVALSWADTIGSVKIETWNSNGYAFEGYNVYQFPSSAQDLSGAKRLATYDIINSVTTIFDDLYDAATGYVVSKPAQYGTDVGIKRAYYTSQDALNKTRLLNGTTYYFGVTSYSFNASPTAKPSQLESSPNPLAVVPQWPLPGTSRVQAGDTAKAVQTVAAGGSMSEGLVMPIIVDPSKTTGHQYRVTFRDEEGTTVWDLFDVTANKYLIQGITNQTGDEDYPIFDGMLVKVTGPATPGMKDYQIPSGVRRWSWAGADGYSAYLEGFNGAMGWPINLWGGNVGPAQLRNVLLKLATATSAGVFTPSDANVSYAYRFMRGSQNPPAVPAFAPYILNPDNYGLQDYAKSCPFSAWNIETTPPTRLGIMTLENNVADGLVDGKYWPGLTSANNTSTAGPREWFFILNEAYSTTPNATYQNLNTGSDAMPLMWVSVANRRADAAWVDGDQTGGDQFLILANHINSPANTFTFTAPVPVAVDQTLAAQDVDRVNVFPNPYIGFNPLEANKYQRFVTFTHMPQKAVVRVFNLSGVLVRTLQKDDPTQFFQWDLRNEQGFPVSAGMYIVHVEMGALGKSKVLKLGVIPEQQFIDKW